MRSTLFRRAALVGAMIVGPTVWSACQSLEVTNPGTPGIDVVYGSGENLEAALLGSWRAFWGVAQGARTNPSSPVKQIAIWGNELTTADVGSTGLGVTQEPRVAIDNRDQGGWTNRKPWYDLYESMSSAREAYQAIENGLKVGPVSAQFPNGQNTERAQVFAKFLIALDNLYLALLFDQAFVTDEKTNPATFEYELRPYTEVAAVSIRMFREAIAQAKAAPDFTLPTTWINGQTITRDDLVRIMYSYIVRAEVYMPRTPTERAAVNWALVLAQLDSGITTKNFAQQADLTISSTQSAYYQNSFLQTNARTNTRLVGPADTSGEYQRWLARPLSERNQITIVTPDRRIQGTTSTSNGKYFGYLATQTMSTANGTYMHSRYRNIRFLNAQSNYHTTGLITTMSVDEMKFIRAEALWRLGRFTEAAALINPTRVANNLKPVTASGPPAGADCVPRKENGACGDLFDAIQYEKRIELFPTEAIISYADARGWGKLLPGTPMHMPVHGRELELFNFPYYTIGGGGPGSAP